MNLCSATAVRISLDEGTIVFEADRPLLRRSRIRVHKVQAGASRRGTPWLGHVGPMTLASTDRASNAPRPDSQLLGR